MAEKNIDVAELRKLVINKSLVIGTEKTLKELKNGNLSKVLLASNCAETVKENIKRYCELSNVPFEELKEDDAEIGILCKKQFSISVAGVLKAK